MSTSRAKGLIWVIFRDALRNTQLMHQCRLYYQALLCSLVAAFPEVHVSHINAFSGYNVEFFNAKSRSA